MMHNTAAKEKARQHPRGTNPFPPAERDHLVNMQRFAGIYPNRVCIPLSRDRYLERTRRILEDRAVRYARVPFRSRDEVYYFFKDYDDVLLLNEALTGSEPTDGTH